MHYCVELDPSESIIASTDKIKLPETLAVTILLFSNVRNSENLFKSLKNGEIEAALIKPSVITDVFQVVMACQRAVRNQFNKRMSTRTVFSEVIYNLSPSKKISDAFKLFGFDGKDEEILAVVMERPDSELVLKLKSQIDGNVISLEKLQEFKNENQIKKVYQIGDSEATRDELLNSILARMACKDFPVLK